jgi:hypothetical protein
MGARLWQHRIGRATAAEARRTAARFPILIIGKTVDCAAPLRQLIEIHDRNCRLSGILAPFLSARPGAARTAWPHGHASRYFISDVVVYLRGIDFFR